MTPEETDALPAGRELDALVAEKVMGLSVAHLPARWVEWTTEDGEDGGDGFLCPRCQANEDDDGPCAKHYSTDIAAAWLVVEELRERHYVFSLYSRGALINDEFAIFAENWEVFFDAEAEHYGLPTGDAEADTAPLAICRAALKAVRHAETVGPV